MIEQALYDHLRAQESLAAFLATYNGGPAVFNQEAPADNDALWGDGPQYGRIVYMVDMQGDPERIMSGTLTVDIMCKENLQFPEEIEPVLRGLIHGWFFSSGTFTVEAQWTKSSYFTEPTDKVTGCTVAFELLAFPITSTGSPDVIARINEWSGAIDGLHVINYDELPAAAWTPSGTDSAIYWRLVTDREAGWIPDTFQTIWRTSTVRGHIFSASRAIADTVARNIITKLYTDKRLMCAGESPIMVNRRNTADYGANPLRTGQLTVEATYGIIVHTEADPGLMNIYFKEEEEDVWHEPQNPTRP